MSTKHSKHAEDDRDDESADNQRVYAAEDAYGPQHRLSAWQQVDPNDLSGGWIEVHLALDCDRPDLIDEVTTT